MPTPTPVTTAIGRFEAARHLPSRPEGHRGHGLHGHGFTASVFAALPPSWAPYPGGEIGQLQQQLARCLAPLDHGLLNEHVPDPTDARLAQWLRQRIDAPGLQGLNLQSTPRQGVQVDGTGRPLLWRRYRFLAAHRLPHVPPGHKCGRMHGHGFEVVVHAAVADTPLTHDDLDTAWAPFTALLHHGCLNELPGLENPTSEMLASWLWARLRDTLPTLAWVTVYETASCGATFDGTAHRIWKDFTLDSAVRHHRAPAGDPRHALHGDTFTLRLHLGGPLDPHAGWTVDFGDVKARFDPVFKSIDHHPLHQMPGLEDADTATLARWIHDRAGAELPALVRTDLFGSDGGGVLVGDGSGGPALPV